MNKVININFHGRVIPIEEQAYDQLKQYIEQLNRFFANEEGKDEIINDIESRIAELLADILKKGETCITTEHINGVLASMGRPEEFETEEPTVKSRLEQTATATGATTPPPFAKYDGKTMARSSTNRIIAGVCGGFGDYFNIDAIWFRVAAVVFFFPVIIAYLVLWAVLPEKADLHIGERRKRLFRDTTNGAVAGVAAGLANYFSISVWIPRIIFLLPIITSFPNWHFGGWWGWDDAWRITIGPGPVIVYIIMWILLPEARTASDRLQMKGQKVDFNSIKDTVTGDLQRFQSKLKVNDALRSGGSSVARVVETLVKVVLYIIVFSVLISLILALGGFGIAGAGMMQYADYILASESQALLAWVALICFFWVPVIGLIVWIIRRLTGSRANSSMLGYSFGALWTLGLVAGVFVIANLSKEFRRSNSSSETVQLANPSRGVLYVQADGSDNFWDDESHFHLEPFRNMDSDTLFAPNMRIEIVRSNDSAYHAFVQKVSNGRSTEQALANTRFPFAVEQQDTVLMLSQGIPISPDRKFRNQSVVVQVAVPIGKQILVEKNVPNWRHVNLEFGPDGDWNRRRRNGRFAAEQDWKEGVLYTMTAEGLQRADGKAEKNEDERSREEMLEEFKRSREKLEEDMQRKREELEEMERELRKDSLQQKNDKPGGTYRYQQASLTFPDRQVTSVNTTMLQVPTTAFAANFVLRRLLM